MINQIGVASTLGFSGFIVTNPADLLSLYSLVGCNQPIKAEE
jgi:hypothetical protein